MNAIAKSPSSSRREQIIQAVLDIIGRRGVTELTTANLAAEVGVTTGALFRHFPNMEAILRGAVERALARIDETFPEAGLSPVERIVQLARKRVRLLGENPGLAWMLRSEQALLVLPADCVTELRSRARRSRKFLLTALKEAAEQGDIRNDIDAEVLLVPLLGTIHALIGMPGAHRPRPSLDSDRVLSALVKLLQPTEKRSKP